RGPPGSGIELSGLKSGSAMFFARRPIGSGNSKSQVRPLVEADSGQEVAPRSHSSLVRMESA
ncbi:MAG: hypothetical protein KDA36_06400, partial [Planctomycetaceae bacterium]|nr:hypothetical protein [Planctomycetaceae bacterium]